jgi:hypothetical protein
VGVLISKIREHASLLTILLVQFIVAFVYSGKSYFFQDDFVFLRLMQLSRLDSRLLTRSIFGHFIPGWVLADKTFENVFGTNYGAARWIMTIAVLLATIALYRLLRALVGTSKWVPIVTAVVALCPITLNAVIWWGVAASVFASNAANIAVFGCFVRWNNTKRLRHLVGMAVMYIIAVSFWEKAAFTGLYVFLFAFLVLDRNLGLRERWRGLWRRWPAWLIFAVVGGLDLGYYFSGTYLDAAGSSPSLKPVIQLLSLSWMEGLAVGVFGIRLPDVEIFSSAALTMAIPALILLAFAVFTCVKSVSSRYVWTFFVIAYLFNQLLLARGRVGIIGIHAGRDLRYQYDNLYLLAICVAVSGAQLPAWRDFGLHVRRTIVASATILVAGCIVLDAITLNRMVASFPGKDVRAYAHNFQRTWKQTLATDPNARLVDARMPERVIYQNFYPYSLESWVLPQLASGVKFRDGSGAKYTVSEDGTVHPTSFIPLATVESPKCAVPVDGAYAFNFPTQNGQYLMARVSYKAKATTLLHLALGPAQDNYRFTVGAQPIAKGEGDIVAAPSFDSVGYVGVTTSRPADVCITKVDVGYFK